MKNSFAVLMILCACAQAHAQADVYLCTDETGKRDYKNSGDAKGCKKIDLPRLTMIPTPTKPTKPKKLPPISIGMTKEEVSAKWGKPSKVNRTQSRRGTDEQWIYPSERYLYFTNGILEVIQH